MNISGLQNKRSNNTFSSRTHDASNQSLPVKIVRQVTEEEAKEFARANDLLWLGETSCYDSMNNCNDIFKDLLKKIHLTQTNLVRRGVKHIDDLRYGEEERNVKYNRCCLTNIQTIKHKNIQSSLNHSIQLSPLFNTNQGRSYSILNFA